MSFIDFKMYKKEPKEKVYENEAEKRIAETKEHDEKNYEAFLETKDSRESRPGNLQKERTTGSPQKDKRAEMEQSEEIGAHAGEEKVMYKRDAKGEILEKMVTNVGGEHGQVERLEIFTPKTEYSKPKVVEMGKVGRIMLLENIIESTEAEEELEKAKQNPKPKPKHEHPSERERRIIASKNISSTKMTPGHDGEVAENYIKSASQYLHKIVPKKYVKQKEKKRKESVSSSASGENKMAESRRENIPHFRSRDRRSVPFISAVEDIPTSIRAAQIVMEVENWEPKPASYPLDPKKAHKRLIKRIEGNSSVETKVMKSLTSQNAALLGCA
jgi:hypothetical protein